MESTTSSKPKFKFNLTDGLAILIWAIVIFITWTFMHAADHYLELTPEALGKYYTVKWFLIAHITTGGGSIIFGFLQFNKRLRGYSWKLHRIIGFLYLLAVLVSSFSAVALAFTSAYKVNLPYAFSLQVWASVWISATFLAYYAALKKRFSLHREWMIRSYLVTLAFVISGLALKTPYVQSLGSFEEISPSLFWMGWSVPLFLYEVGRTSKTIFK